MPAGGAWRGRAGGNREGHGVAPDKILAWLGQPSVPDLRGGEEVREAFVRQHALAGVAFRPGLAGHPG